MGLLGGVWGRRKARCSTYTSSNILVATMTLVTSRRCTLREVRSKSGWRWIRRSINTYPTTKQEGLQLVYLKMRSKYLAMLIPGALSPWKMVSFLGLKTPAAGEFANCSFLVTSRSSTEARTGNTLGISLSRGVGLPSSSPSNMQSAGSS